MNELFIQKEWIGILLIPILLSTLLNIPTLALLTQIALTLGTCYLVKEVMCSMSIETIKEILTTVLIRLCSLTLLMLMVTLIDIIDAKDILNTLVICLGLQTVNLAIPYSNLIQ